MDTTPYTPLCPWAAPVRFPQHLLTGHVSHGKSLVSHAQSNLVRFGVRVYFHSADCVMGADWRPSEITHLCEV